MILTSVFGFAQDKTPLVENIQLDSLKQGQVHQFYLKMGQNATGSPLKIPVLVAKGASDGPVLGLTAAIHGNELNGIAVIHKLFKTIEATEIKGTVIAIPGLNPLAIESNQREFTDGVDLNRIFPGDSAGNRSEQWVYRLAQKIIPLFDYHIDLHTASFGRINSLYGRGDMNDSDLAQLLPLLNPDIIVSNKGTASFGSASGLTLRAYALSLGIKSITVEYGDPQVIQPEMVIRGVEGLKNIMRYLGMVTGEVVMTQTPLICSKSYWVYTDKGGYLEVLVELNQKVTQGQPIALLTDAFGNLIAEYTAPEDGVVIGKSTNPVVINGGRILHLGILTKP